MHGDKGDIKGTQVPEDSSFLFGPSFAHFPLQYLLRRRSLKPSGGINDAAVPEALRHCPPCPARYGSTHIFPTPLRPYTLTHEVALASPLPLQNNGNDSDGPSLHGRQSSTLRVMPLGASITYGTSSTDKNGYRKALRDSMTSAGYNVDMVGSRKSGTMSDNDVEGWPGYTINQVFDKVKAQYHLKPDLVLINAGTNDCTQDQEEALVNAKGRMTNMVRGIFDNIDDVTIVLSGLLPNKNRNDCTRRLNDQYRTIVSEMAGRKIVFADTWGSFTFDDLADTTHPNDAGYKKMADIWWRAVRNAADKGFLRSMDALWRNGKADEEAGKDTGADK